MASKVILKNSFANVTAFGVTVVVTLLLAPFIIYSLGDTDYGIWILIGSISGFYGFLDLGIASSVVRFASKYLALEDSENLNRVVNTCLFIYVLIALLVLIIVFVVALTLPSIMELSVDTVSMLRAALIIVGASVALYFPVRVFRGILQALMRHDIIAGIDIAITFINAALIVVVLKMDGGVVALAGVVLVVKILHFCATLAFVINKCDFLKLGVRFIDREKIRPIVHYSIFSFMNSIGTIFRFNIDTVLIGAFMTVSMITPYSIAQRLVRYFMTLVSEIFYVTTPLYSSYEAKDDLTSIQNLLLKSAFYSALISFFTAAVFIIYGKIFIALWIGEKYALQAYPVLIVLSVGFAVFLSHYPIIAAALGIEKHKVMGVVTIIESVLNVVLSIILVKRYGLLGMALGTTIPLYITRGIVMPLYVCSVIDLSYLKYFRVCFLKPVIVVIAFSLLHYFMWDYVRPDSFLTLIPALLLSSSIYALFTIALFNFEQRRFWKDHLSGLKERIICKIGEVA